MKKIWIIILNRNGIDDTRECLNSLMNNSYPNKEIILVDNASRNNEWSVLVDEYSDDRISFVQNSQNRWFAWGCNDGIKVALSLWCDYVLLFNNDAIAKDGFIEKLLDVIEADRSIWIIGPAITYYKTDVIRYAYWVIWEWTGLNRHKRKWKWIDFLKWKKPYITWYVSGCCMMIKKDLLQEQWLLNEEYFAYYEEVDYCYRATKKWRKCMIVPDSVVEHKKSASAGNKWSNKLSQIQSYLIARNWLLFWRKNLKWIQYIIYMIFQFTVKAPLIIITSVRDIWSFKSYIRWLFLYEKDVKI